MPRLLVAVFALALTTVLSSTPAYACAGLIGSNGTVQLIRTTTLAGYRDGIEHYVTSFTFQGGGGQFGSLVPLPGVPAKVERGGDWTLQRLVRETEPQKGFAVPLAARGAAADRAEVLLEVRIDALDITVLRGGSNGVGEWAKEHGFRLSPDAPEVLDFYANRSPIFLAAIFDGDAAAKKGQRLGDGTPVHVTIPTSNPWVPLRILGLGKKADERINADVFLLTERRPSLLPAPASGMKLLYDQPANGRLLSDLRSDKGMDWVPPSAWLTKLRIDSSVRELGYDLAVDATGRAAPSPIAAGIATPTVPVPAVDSTPLVVATAWAGALAVFVFARRRLAHA